MRILILGASGMLGNAVYRLFSKDLTIETFGTVRNDNIKLLFGEDKRKRLISGVDVGNSDALVRVIDAVSPNVVINCIGLVKQLEQANDPLSAIPINSLLPHRISRICSLVGARFIHISTDCVFSGLKGLYKEDDQADARDIYGVSKYLGEVSGKDCLTLRTSIIGHEIQGNRSLIDWFLSERDSIEGYRHAIFSGLPTVELAQVIRDYVLPNPKLSGLFHLSGNPISKFELLKIVANQYKKEIDIIPNDALKINRSLDCTKFKVATGFKVKPWPQLIAEMHEFG